MANPSWRDQLQPASFRGVPFQVDTAAMDFGRRSHLVEYPFRNDPSTDDMGRRARQYTIDAIILDDGQGDDLFAQRNALIEALEKDGPATLIHPRLGALWVQADKGSWRMTPGANVEKISFAVFEANDESTPQIAVDTLDTVTVTANAANTAQGGMFDKLSSIEQQADHVVQAARDDINRGMAGVKQLVRIGSAAADSVASLSQTIDSAVNDIGNLILMPRTLAATVCALINQALGIDNRIEAILSGYRAIGSLWGDVDPIPQTTPSRITQKNNQQAIAQLFATSATIEATRLVAQQASAIGVTSNADSPFTSAEEAYAVRDELIAALETIALTADDDLYIAIVNLQSALTAHIDAHGNALPHITRMHFNNTMPMLVIAHRIYGDATRDADLIARNRVRHPLFVAAGAELEVLNG